jgi:hypothetical protein
MSRPESQYIEAYLDTTADPATRYTLDTYLHYALRGRAKDYAGRYRLALMRAVLRRIAAGTVVEARSVRGSTAYVRKMT